MGKVYFGQLLQFTTQRSHFQYVPYQIKAFDPGGMVFFSIETKDNMSSVIRIYMVVIFTLDNL